MSVLLVAAGGALGALARLAAGRLNRPDMPWGTLLVNVAGSFALGLLVGLGTSGSLSLGLGTGFLGGLTTFSTLMVEVTAPPVRRWRYLAAATVLGVAAAGLGLVLGRAA